MSEEKNFVPVTCTVDLRRGTHRARFNFEGEEKVFMMDLPFIDGALVLPYLKYSQVDLSLESENLAGISEAMIYFAREYSNRFGGLFLRAKITQDDKGRICLFLENENMQTFKFSLITGLILACQIKATLLLDKKLLEEQKTPEVDDEIIGLV